MVGCSFCTRYSDGPLFWRRCFSEVSLQAITQIRRSPPNQVFGVEIDPNTHAQISEKLLDEFGLKKHHLVLANFFDLDDLPVRRVDAMIGNPPFIRYQRFSGDTRKLALQCAAKQGVQLTELSSSWAPFLVHSIAMVKQGGRTAMVVPMEIVHATYALPVLEHLSRAFGTVTFLTFKKKLFPDLNENTLLLLAEDKGASSSRFLWRDLAHAGSLAEIQYRGQYSRLGARHINGQGVAQGKERLIEYFIPKKARELYHELKSLPLTCRLGGLADVGIGYVTGSNDFFHLDLEETRIWGIPQAYLKPTIRRSRALTGLRFTKIDWRKALEMGEASYLLSIESETDLPKNVRKYIEYGEAQGIPKAYKCRTRSPWFRVPHVYQPDAFLTYMSGATPRLVANDARVCASNSLHILRLRPQIPLTSSAIAALWQTSLTHLSAEIEGHALGGGLLKLEPTEAENVVVAANQASRRQLEELAEELDTLARNGDRATVQSRADTAILKENLGLSQSDCYLLRTAAEALRQRRYFRGGQYEPA